MNNSTLFTCYLIGEDGLLVQCAEVLREKNHTVLGIISPLKLAKEWALENKIAYFSTLEKAESDLNSIPFDYLFSIVNSKILPLSIFNQSRCFAVNFHYSPLPRLAGAHSPSWAILNAEEQYAITWHVVSSVVDAGDVLKQASFTIDKAETAFSLHTKCYQYAVDAFSELVDELENQTYQRCPQNLLERTYYGVHQKPPGNGWISWQDSAETIERLCRALNYRHYVNRFSVAKFSLQQDVFVIDDIKVGALSDHPPGTLVNLSESQWEIATSTKNIILLKISTLQGQPCEFTALAKYYQLAANVRLESPDFASRKQLEKISSLLCKEEDFWRQQLARFKFAILPFLQPFTLPIENNPAKKLTKTWLLPNSLVRAVTANYSEIPFSMIILTAWLIYLYRLGNEDNLGLGFYPPIDTTNLLSTEISPFFARKLPFFIELNDEMNFYDALQQVVAKCSDLKKHLFYDESIWRRYPELVNKTPCFPLAVCLTDEWITTLASIDKTSLITLVISTKKNQLIWQIHPHLLKNNPNLKTIIHGFSSHLCALLQAIVKEQTTSIAKLNLLTPSERKKTLIAWNQTQCDYPNDKTISELFEVQAGLTPKHLAVVCGNHQLTYDALNRRANQMAHYLAKKGLTEGDRVVIWSEPDVEVIISILAILKLGATYICIDFGSSFAHAQSILDDSTPSIVLTKNYGGDTKTILSPDSTYKIVDYNASQALISNQKQSNLNYELTIKNPACIIYTSGTTGKPKGAVILQHAIARLVKNTNYIQISSQDKIAQAASLNFDASIFEIWGALLNGACLVCISKNILLNTVAFANFLLDQQISILWLTSALFDQYALNNPSMFKQLNYLLVGGDVLNKETIKAVLKCPQGRPHHLLNGYGPTENTTFTTTHEISMASVRRPRIPIGKPISNTTVYVLDHNLNPMPIGIPGELYIGGSGLAQGYLNQLSLTKEKFILNPFSSYSDRLYQTGDNVCWLLDGSLDYLGRKDKQVKIRGFRVELDALQACLLDYKAISQCAVCLCNDSKRGKYLIAYLIVHDGTSFNVAHLKKWLNHRLPDYMIPSNFIVLEKLPLTQNGKIDYRSLPLPIYTSNNSLSNDKAPRTLVEKKLAKIWCDLLSLDKIGTEDSFFNLGGHSLLLTQLILKLKKVFNFELSIQDFLRTPTISYLANLKKEKTSKNQAQKLPAAFLEDMKLASCLNACQARSATAKTTNAVLLTGATGFLGVHLLSDLLTASSAKIYCLVRSSSEQNALKTLKMLLSQYHLCIEFRDRIMPLIGDLSKPNLGLTSHQFAALTEKIDCIYHNGAYVHHLYNYETLRAANVLGTVELLKLAASRKIKPFYYVSTLSAVSNYINARGIIKEEFVSHANLPIIYDGYNQSKWVCEYLVAQADSRGIPVKIYRPNWILGQSTTGGIAAEKNHLLLLIKGCIQMGAAPRWESQLSILPVNFVSNFIVNSSTQTGIYEKVFNLSNTHKLTWVELISHLNHFGYSIHLVDPKLWQEKYLNNIEETNALFNLLSLYKSSSYVGVENLANRCNADDSNTRKTLTKLGIGYPSIDKNLLDRYVSYLVKKQFFPGFSCKKILEKL